MPSCLFLLILLVTSWQRVPSPWRLRYVALRLEIAPSAGRIDGAATLTLESADEGPLLIDLSDSLTLDSARAYSPASRSVAGIREPGHVRFPTATRGEGSDYRVVVWYHGTPARRAVGFGGTDPAYRVASYGLPNSAREWWPTLDQPDQKADSADIWITAPTQLVAVSNGTLVNRSVRPDGRTATSHWAERHPVYPDAISFAVGDYAVIESAVVLAGRRVSLAEYAFREDSSKAVRTFAHVPAMLRFLSARLGPYPFADEKYALVEFARHSFREAQTLSHLGVNLVDGTDDAEQVIAHEIAHQWFGNSLTVARWEEIWLNESLAEYMAWHWIRHSRGEGAYRALLDSAVVAASPLPIVPANPADFSTLFGNATFQRGPAVLVLLERTMGSRAFGAAVQRYIRQFAYHWVGTSAFQQVCEAAYGQSLREFFRRFVYGTDPIDLRG